MALSERMCHCALPVYDSFLLSNITSKKTCDDRITVLKSSLIETVSTVLNFYRGVKF